MDDNTAECVICMSEIRDTLILPCRHLCLCHLCADSLRYQANNCPICRAPFRALLQLRAIRKKVAKPDNENMVYCFTFQVLTVQFYTYCANKTQSYSCWTSCLPSTSRRSPTLTFILGIVSLVFLDIKLGTAISLGSNLKLLKSLVKIPWQLTTSWWTKLLHNLSVQTSALHNQHYFNALFYAFSISCFIQASDEDEDEFTVSQKGVPQGYEAISLIEALNGPCFYQNKSADPRQRVLASQGILTLPTPELHDITLIRYIAMLC